ncbi:sialate O-acetylesterase isoform X2 [Hemicordylus capensis]|nr:sialate O-acetylesterase isoform X2 [Hemicordylus capensis]
MVLQKEPAGAVLWGYKDSAAAIMMFLYRENHLVWKVVSEEEGRSEIWKIVLNPMPAGGPYEIVIWHQDNGEMTNVTLEDVYFGDVWLCSGQSNMEMTVSQIFNASEELEEASQFPLVRLFTASLVQSKRELHDLSGITLQWSIPTAKNLGHGDFSYFSAVCWLFGRYLFKTLKYPIGLVESCWGGTPIEAWSSKRVLHECGIFNTTEGASSSYLDSGPKDPSVLWNAMIHPLLNMTIQGVIWYQGEANTVMNTDLYNCTFPALIEDWRKAFFEGSHGETEQDFPFGFVQISTDRQMQLDDSFPRIRWHQTADYGYVPNQKMPNTFMAVAMDLCDDESPYGSIHPRDKQSVAHRLYLGALALAYGKKGATFQGPYPEKVELVAASGLLNVIFGEHIELRHSDNKTFEVCCAQQKQCQWVPAAIASSSFDTVTLHNLACPKSTLGLRYAWMEWPCKYKHCPVYSRHSSLPAPPFITFSHNNPGWVLS